MGLDSQAHATCRIVAEQESLISEAAFALRFTGIIIFFTLPTRTPPVLYLNAKTSFAIKMRSSLIVKCMI